MFEQICYVISIELLSLLPTYICTCMSSRHDENFGGKQIKIKSIPYDSQKNKWSYVLNINVH